jgi:NAD(P)-dependent dehydrogenase (short-subunit alcohol dehydrogenase family)
MSKHEKTAIVTGASGGLGTAIAKALVDHDYNVVLTGTNAERLAAAEAAIGSEAVLSVVADVGAAADRQRLVEAAVARFGRIDVLVNNAGVFELRPFLEVDEATLDRFLSINLKGTYFLTQAVIPQTSGPCWSTMLSAACRPRRQLPARAPFTRSPSSWRPSSARTGSA